MESLGSSAILVGKEDILFPNFSLSREYLVELEGGVSIILCPPRTKISKFLRFLIVSGIVSISLWVT